MSDKKYRTSMDWFQAKLDDANHVAGRFKTSSIPGVAKRMDEELGDDVTAGQREAWAERFLEKYKIHRAAPTPPADFAEYTPVEKLEWERDGKVRASLNPRGIIKPPPKHPGMMRRQDFDEVE